MADSTYRYHSPEWEDDAPESQITDISQTIEVQPASLTPQYSLQSQAASQAQLPSSQLPNNTQSSQRSRPYNAIWNPEMEYILLSEMRDQVRQDKRADSGFKAEAWSAVIEKVNYSNDSISITVKQAKSKMDWYKLMYKEWQLLGKASGFGYDEQRDIYVAIPSVWSQYLSSHKQATWLRTNSLPYRDILGELFDGVIATGNHAYSMLNNESSQRAFASSSPASTPTSINQHWESNSESERSRKRSKNKARIADGLIELANAFGKSQEHVEHSTKTGSVSQAIQLLCTEYESRLSESDFDIAIDKLSVKETAISNRVSTASMPRYS
ncbi:hypothetical protein F5884DRAFT_814298 [Xylogone sp. PMI_703]|nr:hypothetical protein F5884DRAFT_814298 [Xylogone sp. PMI_703]